MTENPVPNSFSDFFEKEQSKNVQAEQETLEQKFAKVRTDWTVKIKDMSAKMKKIFDIQDLMGNVYTDRQLALEYYHMIISLLVRVNKEYRTQYTKLYDHYSFKGQKRFPNETSKNNQILSEMEDIISKKESLNNQAKFMENTIKTVDNVIFGMKYRIEIEQISRGK